MMGNNLDPAETPSKSNAAILIGALIVFAAVFGGFGTYKYTVASASSSWPTTQSRITASRLDRTGSGSDTKYRPSVSYRYSVQGTDYTGKRIRAVSSYTSRGKAESELARYPSGATVTVYYDPADPASSVLVPGVTMGIYLMLAVGVACLVLAIAILVSALRR
jgi:hypothetical protein